MSRLALVVAALVVTVSGFAFGASMAIGARGLFELALGAPTQSASAPAERLVAEAGHPDRVDPRGALWRPPGSTAERPPLELRGSLWLPDGSNAVRPTPRLTPSLWRSARVEVARSTLP